MSAPSILETSLKASPGSRYIMSFWFMLSILIGSERGNVDPVTGLEKVVTILFEMMPAPARGG